MDNTPSNQALHAFLFNPSSTQFESQLPGEIIILLLRAHPITQIRWIINSILFVLVLLVLNLFIPQVLTINEILFTNAFGFAMIFSYIFYNFLIWYFHVGIVTTERIVDIDLTSILYKEVTAVRINKIEEVTSKTGGYLGSLFDYGDVHVQTASGEANIEFMDVPHPARVVEIINNSTANQG